MRRDNRDVRKEINEKTEELLKLVRLENADKRIHGFSRGMKQRLGIAQALLNSPKLLICDEPTSALDPVGRKEILDILYSVKEHTTVLFSTHILSDVERICDRIAFLHKGTVTLTGTLEELKEIRKKNSIEIEFQSEEDADMFLKDCCGSTRIGKTKVIFSGKSESGMPEIMRILLKYNMAVQRVEQLEPTLEDVFLEVTEK